MGKKLSGEEKAAGAVGCLLILFYLAWVGFIVWAIYTLVSWLVTK